MDSDTVMLAIEQSRQRRCARDGKIEAMLAANDIDEYEFVTWVVDKIRHWELDR